MLNNAAVELGPQDPTVLQIVNGYYDRLGERVGEVLRGSGSVNGHASMGRFLADRVRAVGWLARKRALPYAHRRERGYGAVDPRALTAPQVPFYCQRN